MGNLRLAGGAVAATTLVLTALGTGVPATAGGSHDHHHHGLDDLNTVVEGLDGPRGVDALGHGWTVVSETDGSFSLVIERRHHGGEPKVVELGQVPGGFAPAVSVGKDHTVWVLTGAGEGEGGGAATLYRWKRGWDAPEAFADIAAYQATDPDPYDLEDNPTDSNPFGVAALRDGSVLVSDAAGNDLLRVMPDRSIVTVARLMPRTVEVPEGLPDAGTTTPAEAVATSVTVGADGYWYVGELRGYPATAGTSEIWRIKPGTTDAVCDPEKPWGSCKRYADGLTSIVDLGADWRGIYAVTLSKMTWLAIEAEEPVPGAEIGGLFLVSRGHHHGHHHHSHGKTRITELVPDQLTLPGGVDVADGTPYVVGPVFGPGSLARID
jgi:hypothetical protein